MKLPCMGARKRHLLARKSPFLGKKSPPVGKKFALLGLENRPFGTRKSPFVGKELALLELENLRHLCCQEVKSHLVTIKSHSICKINIQHPNQLHITKFGCTLPTERYPVYTTWV